MSSDLDRALAMLNESAASLIDRLPQEPSIRDVNQHIAGLMAESMVKHAEVCDICEQSGLGETLAVLLSEVYRIGQISVMEYVVHKVENEENEDE